MSNFLKKNRVFSFFPRVRLLFFLLLLTAFLGTAVLKAWLSFSEELLENRPVIFLEDWQTQALPFDMGTLRLFAFPEHTCPIDAYGAQADVTTPSTAAIARAIADCSAQGGGTVVVPAGRYLTGPIRLESNIALHIEEGAELFFSQNFRDYLPVVFSRYEGMEYYGYSPLIYARDCHDIAITGEGVIDGQGQAWWEWKRWQQQGAKKLYALAEAGTPPEERVFGTVKEGLRPSLIGLVNCDRVRIEGVTIKNGPQWTLHPLYSKDVLIRDVTIETAGPNTDGIVIDSSENVLIDQVRLDTGDDAIAIKSGVDSDGRRVGRPSQNIVIRNCAVGRGNGGVVIGSEMSGDVRNVSVTHCQFDGTKRGLRMKSTPGRGGVIENIWFEDISMQRISAEAVFLDMFYDSKNVVRPLSNNPPTFRNFSFKNIRSLSGSDALVAVGTAESPIRNLTFDHAAFTAERGVRLENIDTVAFHSLSLRAASVPTITLQDVQHAAFTESSSAKKPSATVSGRQSQSIYFADTFPLSSLQIGREVPGNTVTRELKK